MPCSSVSHRVTKHITAVVLGWLLLIKRLVFVSNEQPLQNSDEFLTLISPFPSNMPLWPTNMCMYVCVNCTTSLEWMNTPVCLDPGVPCRWWCTAALLQLVATDPYFIRCNNHAPAPCRSVWVIIGCYLVSYRQYDKHLCPNTLPLEFKRLNVPLWISIRHFIRL